MIHYWEKVRISVNGPSIQRFSRSSLMSSDRLQRQSSIHIVVRIIVELVLEAERIIQAFQVELCTRKTSNFAARRMQNEVLGRRKRSLFRVVSDWLGSCAQEQDSVLRVIVVGCILGESRGESDWTCEVYCYGRMELSFIKKFFLSELDLYPAYY